MKRNWKAKSWLGIVGAAVMALPAFGQSVATQVPEVLESRASAAETNDTPAAPPVAGSDLAKGAVAKWIWGASASKKYLMSKEVETGAVSKAVCRFTCDNEVKLKVNGKDAGASTEWQAPVTKDVTDMLKPGKNTILAEVANEGSAAGFAFKMIITGADGKTTEVVSDESWSVVEAGKPGATAKPKVVGKMGDNPWGNVFAGSVGRGGAQANQGFQLPEGFQIERLFTVPKATHGSWVCLTTDDKGRLIASDQGGMGLYRIIPGKPGTSEPTKVEKLDVKMTGAQGMLFAFGSLYVCANGGPGSGLYRLRDTNGDDQFDEVVKLKELRGGGEHGPHALRLSPDGKSILVSCGNHTLPPADFKKSRVPSNWSEDHLLPRQWDANGHARGILAPGGYIAKTDPEGKEWEIVSIGYRNQYDFAFNPEGEMFVYDADMEWDFGMPWYRPTRVNHATSGSELGWRSGTGKWPPYYVDSLPAMVDIGPGSPVGVEFGTGAKFPAKYQKALYICDWTFGTMYAIHTTPSGSTYAATKEEFVSRAPLPLTDVVIGKDGAMYFTVGGRGTQSELYRVTYVGKESTAPVVQGNDKSDANEQLRQLRRKLEAFHGDSKAGDEDLKLILANLSHKDRFIRYAARVALEHQGVAMWRQAALATESPAGRIQGVVALARQGDKGLEDKAVDALLALDFKSFDDPTMLDWLRSLQVVFARMGEPGKATAAKALAALDPLFPAKNAFVNRELINLVVYLDSPTVAGKAAKLLAAPPEEAKDDSLGGLLARNSGYGGTINQVMANRPDAQKIHYLFALRNLKNHWTIDQRKAFFTALNEARTRSGGASYQGFLNNIEKDAYENAKDTDRLAIEALGLRKPAKAVSLPKPAGPGKAWTLDELAGLTKDGFKGRNFANGKKSFASARCVVCHRFNGEGGATGPDLSQVVGRFSPKDLAESIVDPNKVISDQYRASTIETNSGKVIAGKIVNETAAALVVVTDPEDSTKVLEVKKSDVESIKPSPVSLMPGKLIDGLNKDEVLDLLAYMLSRGDATSPFFGK